ncbi:MAG: tRNA (guanosine(37)-N1)-methyltransferase TrmD [Epsilonproteobacteria bacterium]|jgi:tRNA (guanine37-N1)-methyltransferase|nr:tRNA (guanosine(37)-N1)-methyltransferase TrmD [Campylobacterota bacterium]NPA89295.1 tRNA (guanosine(37)-N1)-methyltransferase TrmD [Campylobacterota bacterium]
MRLLFFTLFPELILPYFSAGVLGRAQKKGLFQIGLVNFREFAQNRWKKVDTPLAGGGAGMVIDNSALRRGIEHYRKLYPKSRVIFLTPVGKTFTQRDALRLARQEETIFLVSGRYEGFDERLIEDLAEEVFSIGDYILSGGELPALVVADAVLRNIPGVLGNRESLEGESFGEEGILEGPNFSKEGDLPPILKSGHHRKIAQWRYQLGKLKTLYHRGELPWEVERG